MSESNPVGRPTKYHDDYPAQAYKLALLGATDKEIADFFEINQDTIYEWQKQYPKFSESIRDGKVKADSLVAQKLYDKAVGPEWIEEQAFKVKKKWYDENGKVREEEEVVTVPVKRAAPPDTPAISLWLRNRQSAKWKDKLDHDITSDGKPINDPAYVDARLAQLLGKVGIGGFVGSASETKE